jgi:hypothetical protein
MNGVSLKKRVGNTIKQLARCKLTLKPQLYSELEQYIDESHNEVFQQDSEGIIASCSLLGTISINSVEKEQKQSLMADFKRESEILLRSLRLHTKKTKNYPYTPLQILLKLELLFDPILDHTKVCHNTDLELSNCFIKPTNQTLTESTILEKAKSRLMLLHELADAPLDDIITYLHGNDKTFYDFYNNDKITYVVYRLRNLSPRAQRSTNVYDKLCFFISCELTEKYQLDVECFAQLLLDQFECIDEGCYRKKLIEFVENVYTRSYQIYQTQSKYITLIY